MDRGSTDEVMGEPRWVGTGGKEWRCRDSQGIEHGQVQVTGLWTEEEGEPKSEKRVVGFEEEREQARP